MGDLHELGEHTNITLYRIVQECLTNISKHANANKVNIVLNNDQHELLLSVTDNGSGFNMQSYSRGLGLIGMRERVASLNGNLQLDSEPGKGVTITITIPLNKL